MLLLLALAGCRQSSTAPTPAPSAGTEPAVTCPGAIVADTDQSSLPVAFPLPIVTGGLPPITVACTHPTNAAFSAGTTNVTCYATDGAARTTQCSFQITIRVAPKLKGVKFLAFGDSITAGEVGDPVASAQVQAFRPDDAYPSLLVARLRERYRLQSPVVVNAGLGGELVTCPPDRPACSTTRLVATLQRERPDALLLMEGANDLGSAIAPALVADALRDDVRRAYAEGVSLVFIATVTPQVPGRFRAFAPPGSVEQLNGAIRGWASSERAVLVDAYAAIAPSKEVLVGADGLHTTLAGNQAIAEAFFTAIQASFELPPPSGPAPVSTPAVPGGR